MTGIRTSRRTGSLIGLIGFFAVLFAIVVFQANQPAAIAPTQPAAVSRIATEQPEEPISDQLLADAAVIINYENYCRNDLEFDLLMRPTIVAVVREVIRLTPPDVMRAAVLKAKPETLREQSGYCADTAVFVQNFTRNFFNTGAPR